MFSAFEQSPLAAVLAGMARPQMLPFYEKLASSSDPPCRRLLPPKAGSAMDLISGPLFSYFFEGVPDRYQRKWRGCCAGCPRSGISHSRAPAGFIAPPFMTRPDIHSSLNAEIAPSRLVYDAKSQTIRHIDGSPITSSSAAAGGQRKTSSAAGASGSHRKGAIRRVGIHDAAGYPRLMYQGDRATTADNSVIIRSGETWWSSAVNIDLVLSLKQPFRRGSTRGSKRERWIRLFNSHCPRLRVGEGHHWNKNSHRTSSITTTRHCGMAQRLRSRSVALSPEPIPVGDSPSPVDDKLDASASSFIRAG